jgi:hypothetical protein
MTPGIEIARARIFLSVLLLNFVTPLWGAVPSRIFDVRDHGAMGDGRTIDTIAINRAIDACAATGGGQVFFPPGTYLTGTLKLRSNLAMVLSAGATLAGSTNLSDYQAFQPPDGTPEARFRRNWHRALLLGENITNLTLVGPGVIDGRKVFDPQGEERMRGPHTLLLGVGREIVIRDLTIRDSANYAVMLEDCQQVEIEDVRITGGWDGVHFRGWPGRPCRDVNITRCQFYTGDDAIAGRYWENVVIAGCIFNSSCNGIRLIGPASHLIIQDCLFYGPGQHPHRTSNRFNMLSGILLQPGAWDATEGTLDDVLISDVTMKNVASPVGIWLRKGNTGGRITVDGLRASGIYRAAVSVESWAESPVTNVVFRDLSLEFAGGGQFDAAQAIVKLPGVDARSLPAWGFYARKVQHLALENVRLSWVREDHRPVLMAQDVGKLELDEFRYPRSGQVAQPLVLTNVDRVEYHTRENASGLEAK